MDETDEVGECQESRRHEDLEFNSFALDLSFGGNSSFGSTADGGYSTLSRAVFHIFKGNVGAGVFLLPAFYKDAGYLLGGILIVLLGALMIDCVSLLLKIKLKADRPDVKTYPAVVGFVLGGFFLQVTKFSLIFTQFGFCVMFVQYASSIFSELFCGGGYYPLFVLLSVVVVTPFTFFSNKMGILAYASIIAGLFVAAVLVGTTAADIKYLHDDGVAPGIHAVVPTARLLVFLSGHMFSLEGIGVVLPVENSLAPQDRPTFRIVVKYTLAVVVAIYITFGILGYMAYGETLHNSVVVALPSSHFKNVLQCLLGLSLLFGYPIQYVPAIQLVDKSLGVSLEGDRKKALGLRLLLNTMFGLCAAFIGGETINIFASFLGSFVGFT
ncbi:solute carrier family 36 (proton-coupled amino acid transporter) [Angomonas deanei]|nr:solute carrier family 36 (proton-coupled amino acid transporter) [Angomonas deanei]|eukprot:EPY29697.1 solute carrier family 36 (proton-coupled amino acid transporter) [Angomonas deanei]